MFNIVNCERNASQNYNEVSHHIAYNGHHQKNLYKINSGEGVGKRTLLPCSAESKLVRPLQSTVWRFPKKLKTELPYDPVIPLLDIYCRKIIIWKDTCTPMFTAALLTIVRVCKPPKCPSTEEWIKMWCILIHTMAYYSTTKNKIMPFAATWMDQEIVVLTVESQTY